MYVGRFVALGATPSGQPCIAHRVSSRTFPDRAITVDGHSAHVHQRDDEHAEGPFVDHECYREVGPLAVVGNGGHVTAIADRLQSGSGPFDAATLVLAALGHMDDEHATPRITAITGRTWARGLLATIGGGWLQLEWVDLTAGSLTMLATYDEAAQITSPLPIADEDGPAIAAELLTGPGWSTFEHPVASIAAVGGETWTPSTAIA